MIPPPQHNVHISNATAGIQKLPDNILSRIFTIIIYSSLQYESAVNLFVKASSKTPLWCLQLVCLRWREVIRNTPTLWSVFELSRTLVVKPFTVDYRVRVCLEYSGNAPLNIRLLPANAKDIPSACLEDIAGHVHRWREVNVYSNFFVTMGNLTAFKKKVQTHGLPQLNTFGFYGGASSYPLPLPRNHEVLNCASALESISFHNISFNNPAFTLTSVKALHINSCIIQSESALGALLLSFQNLRSLHWENVSCIRPLSQPLELPSLHTLAVHKQNEDMNAPWRMLRVPALRELVLTDVFEDLSPVVDMVRISKCVVKRLKLALCQFSSFYDITNQQFAGVTELCIAYLGSEYESTTTQILSQLIWDSSSSAPGRSQMLPLLQILEIQPSSNIPSNEVISSLMNVMQSRSSHGLDNVGHNYPVPLLVVKYGPLCYSDYVKATNAITQLEQLGEELGIKVEVSHDY